LDTHNAFVLNKRRVQVIGLSATICCHTFRITGIPANLVNGGTLTKTQSSSVMLACIFAS
jgi:hypothetical protein